MTILAIIALGLAVALANGFKYLATSKERAAAVQAANALIERARSVSEADWTQVGLVSADIAGDSNITSGTCGTSTGVSMYSGEPVVAAGTTTTNPLYPHVQTQTIGSTIVTLKAYVTGVTTGGCSVSNPTYKHVTVLATWSHGQNGVSNEVRLATYLYKAVRPPDPSFQATASYSAGLISAHQTIGVTPAESAVYLPQSAADGRNPGRIEVEKSSGTTPLEEVSGTIVTQQHQATSIADDDDLTSIQPGNWPSPVCSNGSWTDFAGGLLNLNVLSSASSCSSVLYSDSLPYTSGTAALSNTASMTSVVPGANGAPAFTVTNFSNSGSISTTSTVDRNVTNAAHQRNLASAAATFSNMNFLSFTALGYSALNGSVQSSGGTFTATANAGQGTGADPVATPAVSGSFTFKLYDPNSVLTGCGSRSLGYCVIPVDPTVNGFSGFDQNYQVVLSSALEKITLATHIVVQPPTTDVTWSGNDATFERASFPLPKITATMTIEAPAGTTIATVDAVSDLGQLIADASYGTT